MSLPTSCANSFALSAPAKAYARTVAARGFAYMADQPAIQELLTEQNYLIEGLTWAWILEVLPEVLRRGRILEVEHDDTYVFGCTCGLSDGVGSKADHEARDCQGIGWLCKPDFILETWETGELEYHEFKDDKLAARLLSDDELRAASQPGASDAEHP